jgi:hypothetical protein
VRFSIGGMAALLETTAPFPDAGTRDAGIPPALHRDTDR